MLKILKRAVPLVTAFTLIGAQLCAKSADKTPNEIKTELAFSVLTKHHRCKGKFQPSDGI